MFGFNLWPQFLITPVHVKFTTGLCKLQSVQGNRKHSWIIMDFLDKNRNFQERVHLDCSNGVLSHGQSVTLHFQAMLSRPEHILVPNKNFFHPHRTRFLLWKATLRKGEREKKHHCFPVRTKYRLTALGRAAKGKLCNPVKNRQLAGMLVRYTA